MPMDLLDSPATKTSVSAAGMILGAIFASRKLLKFWKESSIDLDAIESLHGEITRLGNYNKVMSEELGKVQKEFLELNRNMRELAEENQTLRFQVKELTLEVERLNHLLEKEREGR